MKSSIFYIVLVTGLFFTGCINNALPGNPVVAPATIQKSLMSWIIYKQQQVSLSVNFTALGEALDTITKESFLKQLTSGDFIPLKLITKDAKPCYQLYKLNRQVDTDIAETIKNFAITELDHYKMEGKLFPVFNFVDLNGKHYNKENTKGKILVLKCWFIHCRGCEEEREDLNKLVDKYKSRQDIIFLSLASDSADSLTAFLSTKTFKYAIVANQDTYMFDRLNVNMFPTHFIIDKAGVIVKKVNRSSELIFGLNEIVNR